MDLMRRLAPPFYFLALIGLASSTNAADPHPRSLAAGPPNILLIISDDQAWTDFGFMHHPAIRTPHLDRLAAHSAVFRRGYVPTSLCRPSLATLITGLYPHQHKISGNDPPAGTDRGALLKHVQAVPTLPRLLAKRGYRSFQSGKWWEGHYSLGGFTDGMTHGDPQRGGRHGDEGLRIGREGLTPVLDFISGCADRPFFIWYAPMMPHVPHSPPERLLARYRSPGRPDSLARYFAMCEWFDETCGELFDFLERTGKSSATLVIFVVDNGWAPPDPGATENTGQPARFAPHSKLSPYDGGVRTPILVSWPGRISPGESPALVSSIDVAPTILAAAGLSKDAAMPGISLLDVIAAGGVACRPAVFGEIFDHDVVDIDHPVQGLRYRWCVEGNWKLILPVDHRQPAELYNIVADPHEQRNRAGECGPLVDVISRELEAWWPVAR